MIEFLLYPPKGGFFCFYMRNHQLKQIKKSLENNQGSGIVGVFDSGAGGLSVLGSLMNKGYKRIVYLGDTKNFPYGEKTFASLSEIILQRITDLINYNAERILIACNTASINFSKMDTKGELSTLISGTIDCTARYVASRSHFKRVGLIGSNYTVLSKEYYKEINKLTKDKSRILIQSAEQELIKFIENNNVVEQRKEVLRICNYFNSLQIHALILGCTHFTHVKSLIKESIHPNIELIDPSELLPNSFEVVSKETLNTKIDFYFSGQRPQIAEKYLSL